MKKFPIAFSVILGLATLVAIFGPKSPAPLVVASELQKPALETKQEITVTVSIDGKVSYHKVPLGAPVEFIIADGEVRRIDIVPTVENTPACEYFVAGAK